MGRDATIVKFRDYIFEDADNVSLTPLEHKQLLRLRSVVTLQLERPSTSNTEIVAMLTNMHGVSVSQAYRDIASTHLLLGSVPNASKQWIRYMTVETLKGVIENAEAVIQSQRVPEDQLSDNTYVYYNSEIVLEALAVKTKAADKLAKYARLDQSDPDPIPFEEIVPLNIDYVNDPSILTGVQVDDPKAAVKKVLDKYANYEEVE